MSGNEITINDIDKLCKQVDISKENAFILLDKHSNDQFEALLDAYKLLEGDKSVLDEKLFQPLVLNNNTLGVENETDTVKKLEKFRYILDEKDKIFQDKMEQKIDTTNVEKYYYIEMNYNTNNFTKRCKNCRRYEIQDDLVRKYLSDNYIFNDNEDLETLKIMIRYLGDKKLCKKWNLNKSGMFYFKNQIKSNLTEHEFFNKYGTKFLQNSGQIKDNQILIGPCMIINNWF